MNPGLKQRLVGAIVLIALAVIFLPMLLPGNNDSTMPLFGSNVPDAPASRFEPIEIPLQLPPASGKEEVVVVDQPQTGEQASSETPQQTPLVEPEAVLPKAETPAAATKPVAVAPTKPAPAPAPGKPAEAWVVQLGSFSSSVNALALQEKARKAGFRAYVEKVKGAQGVSYRVRIGPESNRERAEAVKAKVVAQLKMSAIVVPHK